MRIFLLFFVILVVFLLYYGARWFSCAPLPLAKRRLKQVGIGLAALVLIVLAVTGRIHWLFGLLGGALPMLQRLWMLRRLWGQWQRQGSPFQRRRPSNRPHGQTSRIETEFFRMELDHDSGNLDGEVLKGEYRGQWLSELTLETLRELLRHCRSHDTDSTRVLEAYMDRRFGDWRDETRDSEHRAGDATGGSEMTIEEAYSILGLQPGAAKDDIKQAHKRLIQKLHPDRGGSAYLAAKLNQAKECLLKHHQ